MVPVELIPCAQKYRPFGAYVASMYEKLVFPLMAFESIFVICEIRDV
jgi:hypothetical protein